MKNIGCIGHIKVTYKSVWALKTLGKLISTLDMSERDSFPLLVPFSETLNAVSVSEST